MLGEAENPAYVLQGGPGFGIRAAVFASRFVKPAEDQGLYTAIYNIVYNFFTDGPSKREG